MISNTGLKITEQKSEIKLDAKALTDNLSAIMCVTACDTIKRKIYTYYRKIRKKNSRKYYRLVLFSLFLGLEKQYV